MRIAITGNLGYIGPVVVEHLACTHPHAELIGIDTGFFASRGTDPAAVAERFLREQRYADIRDLQREDFVGIDAIVHLAALSNDPLSKRFEVLTAEINQNATVRLAKLARAAGVRRFILASSCSVYGAAEQDLIDEDAPINPLTPYAQSKIGAEQELRQLASSNFLVTCLRFATAYGWSPRLRLDLVLNDFVASAFCSGEIVLSSTGEAWRPLIHVRDMARAMEWGLVRTGEDFLSVNAGSTVCNWRIIDLAQSVADALGEVSIRRPASAPADRRSYRVDFSRFEKLAPSYAPREVLAGAVNELKEGLSRIGYKAEDRRRLVRLDTLEELQNTGKLDTLLRWKKPLQACRLCGAPLEVSFADLGETPLANDYLEASRVGLEVNFQLHVWVCTHCWLVQVGHLAPPETIFSDYAYLSSYSPSWVEHARQFTEVARKRLDLTSNSRVVEIASNDGYLLQHFVQAGVPCLGVEPAQNVAEIARGKGIPTVVQFFNATTALQLLNEGGHADLTIANNVLAHVPDPHAFVAGFTTLLHPNGVATFEFPHLLELIRHNQFDTIYHEHYSYFSLIAAQRLFAMHRLRVFDVQRLGTHGGSLRLWVCHDASTRFATSDTVPELLKQERDAGLETVATYTAFASQADRCRTSLINLLNRIHAEGKTVAAYGAAAKGNTLLNYCGISNDRIAFVADLNPLKQGRYLPGSHIPVVDPEEIGRRKPDYLLILPWNLTDEIRTQMSSIRNWGGRFIRPVPEAEELG